MKNYREDINMSMKVVEKQIWQMFDVLRSHARGNNDYYVILLLLSLYKDNQISKSLLFEDFRDEADSFQMSLQTEDSIIRSRYSKIMDLLSPMLLGLNDQGFRELIDKLFQIDKSILTKHFSSIFDAILYQVVQSQGRYGAESLQPIEITRFMCALADIPQHSKIFNPFAGFASFGVFLNKEQNYFGQEISPITWAIGALRLMAYNKPVKDHYVCEGSIINWPRQSEKFDLIIANPPYNLRLAPQFNLDKPHIRTAEQFLIEEGINSLKKNGKLVVLMPHGFLFRGGQEKILRERLIKEDLIDTIISLPGGLLLNTGIPLIVLVINKAKKLRGKVSFIDAKKFVETKNSKEKSLNDIDLIRYIRNESNRNENEDQNDGNGVVNEPIAEYESFQASILDNEDSEIERIVDITQIKDFDYNLNVPRYFKKPVEGKKLKEILEYVSGRKDNLSDEGKLIRIRDLKDDKLDYKLDLSNVEVTEFARQSLRMIDEPCLLLATRWKTLKPTLFEFADDPIFLNSDILSFKINEQLANTAYLINELHADYVEEQLASYRQGATIPMIRRDDLLEVVIKLPSLEEQRAKMQGIEELSDKINILQRERNELAHGKETSQFNEFASLKHTIGTPRQNILDWTDNLIDFLSGERSGIEELNKNFLKFYDTDILSALKEIKRDINFITEVLEKGENGFIVEDFEKTLIPLTDVNSLINALSTNSFNFKIEKLLLKGERLNSRGVSGNIMLLKILIDNVLTNAHKYGFQKKERGNKVVFELMEVDNYFSLEIRNNGNPFPKNFDREKFITKYSTADSKSGTGLGGYDIHRIAKAFKNPDWKLILNADPIYPVIFRFKFFIKPIN